MNTRLTLLVLLALAASSACTEVALKKLGEEGDSCRNTDECALGLVCTAQICVPDVAGDTAGPDTFPDVPLADTADVEDTAVADTQPDTQPDTVEPPDTADEVEDADDAADAEIEQDTAPEVVEDTTPDVPADTVPDTSVDTTPDVPPDTAPELPPDVPEDGDDAEDGEVDAGPGPGPPLLGEPCDGPCAPGLVCMPQDDGTKSCGTFPEGVCLPCELDVDCPGDGAKCVDLPGGEQVCGASCGSNTDCPKSFLCDDGQCVPETFTCTCSGGILGFTLGCINENEDGACSGLVTCQLDGWSACSALPPGEERCDGIDNDCDGFIDEEPFYIEKGQQLAFGAPCGIGQCTGGEVVCAPDGTANCSTNVFATPEGCADNIDNNCDGTINEDCASKDFDGDGVPNDVDCAPFDSGIYQGAPELCCPEGMTTDPMCDANCDGQTTPCAACDADGDGQCPPQDCNDGNPTIFAGAPDKCNDGIDQDCLGGDLLCSLGQDKDNDGYIPPADCNANNPAVHPWADELCDNLDNDCDGITDEGNPQAGQPCGTGSDYCKSGLQVCTHYGTGAAIQCQGAVLDEPERCDGIDNDCNGQTDELWPALGSPCDGPDIDSCDNGVLECLGDGSGPVCGPEAIANIVETCNDLDDDCDGATDEFVCKLFDLDGDGVTEADGDCDDFRSEVYPGAPEPCCDPALGAAGLTICDRNCDGIVAPCAPNDVDADGFSPAAGDCDDSDPRSYPGAPEKCDDGVDQDCVGGDLACSTVSDADFDGFHSGIDCNDNDSSVNPWAKETCNFVDDDCDGVIDEGNPTTKVGPCGPDVPECTPGAWVCAHDPKTATISVLCVNENFQADEICNDLDDDCDGTVDETFFELGMACDGPDTDLCENGFLVCSAEGDGVACGEELLVDLPEICDTLDNDCDGETDEGLTWEGAGLGAVCDGTGQCGPGVVICTFLHGTTCSTNPDGPFSQAKPEKCNGLDDDCDGLTDEDFFYKEAPVGAPCEGLGECGAGLVECAGVNAATCSTNADGSESEATPELCDGLDTDCDNHVDEDIPLADSPCKQVGVCAGADAGVAATCQAAVWSCSYAGVADYEDDEVICDGLDNDCDGETDDPWPVGEPCDGPDTDQCKNGLASCSPGGNGVVCLDETETDIAEVCNGVDDDCDGLTDEVQADPASAGCKAAGVCSQQSAIVVFCGPDGLVCDYDGIAGYQDDETLCDGLDNDCDGQTDEDLTFNGTPLNQPCEGLGVCGQGTVQCNALKKTVICSTMAGGAADQSKPELCDDLDNDCDGLTDEAFLWNGQGVDTACDGAGQCGAGVVECSLDASKALCSTEAGGSEDESVPELCNAIDDDCNGQTDEAAGLDKVLSECPDTGVCETGLAQVACEGGAWMCHLDTIAGYEAAEATCDDLDNDCDGQTDEHQPFKGTACDGPDPDSCATGIWGCSLNGKALICENETGVAGDEVCDGVDNDCDGATDEDITWQSIPKGQPCDGLGACGVGLVVCNAEKAATCSTNPDGTAPGDQPETCNGADDDCDGLTDDGLFWDGVEVGDPCDGTGSCGAGTVVCSPVDGTPTCSTNPNGTAPGATLEICNSVDDDCDGQTDEDYADFGKPCDSTQDADLCKTGFRACVAGVESCVNDVACPPGAGCLDPGGGQQEYCVCLGFACPGTLGDACTAQGCRCAGGPACTAPQKCVAGVGCQ